MPGHRPSFLQRQPTCTASSRSATQKKLPSFQWVKVRCARRRSSDGSRQTRVARIRDFTNGDCDDLMWHMKDEHEVRESRGIGSFVIWTFIVIVAYLLSTGPAALIDKKTN